MSLETQCTEDITVLRYSVATQTTDSEGITEDDDVAEHTYPGLIQQQDAREVQVGPDTQISDHLLTLVIDDALDPALLPRVQLDPRDRIRRGTQVFQVIGEPDVPRTPIGPSHIEANLKLVANP